MPPKPFDIILIGATGFTGKRAAQYLKDHTPDTLKYGIAARNPDKLGLIAEKLNFAKNQCFTIDTTIREQVETVVKQARIIITTVGPFSLYGEEVIAACAKFGTHYLDITGEVGFIKKMKNKYEKLAKKTGAKLIPFSGFDSVPADIAAFLLSKEFDCPEKLDIRAYYSISGGFNGGTIATMMNKFETGEYKKMADPKLLIDKGNQQIHTPKRSHFFGYDKKIHRWSAPFIMGSINSKIVYKSASMMHDTKFCYAKSISYSEHSSLGKWYNPIPFILVSIVLLSITVLGPKKWFRKLLQKVMPAPGEGPSEKKIEKGYFKMTAFADDYEGNKTKLQMSYPGDPGNKSTVFFLCESALCLLESTDKDSQKNGFLTPITAFGDALIERMTSKGLFIKMNP
ncbi:MAG: saccharopine dehydrogenase NADP-binding domain-containing protein [Gracilimonas sp.]|uniref:saccharopine dehydrogenase family protein n=1 Tax=Gracilimonas sp. TaxID=1974203 RepID=UPI00198D40DC|nr:saccharopine dehydrogenase NADP-binding domain-containing protein [Gracilimonas sp.]MBD3615200.1 saccharopine dehydrogenase NADP-binding domain-containing protein [Gracilimonas sp.]